MSDKICSSADKVLEVFLENTPMDTSHHRMVKQQYNMDMDYRGYVERMLESILSCSF